MIDRAPTIINPNRREKFDSEIKNKKKRELGLYLTTTMPFSYHNIQHYVYIATRGVGKSVISVETVIQLKRKYGYDNVKAFYFRLTDLSIKAALANKAEKSIDPYLIKKYNLEITCKGNIIYDHGKRLIEFYPLVSAGSKGKGVNLYDCNFFNRVDSNGKKIKTFIVTIWDEFLMADGIEKKSVGDPVGQYKIYMEAILRDAQKQPYDAVKCFYLANAVSECASVTGALFNYIPDPNNHKIVKLTRKNCIFWVVPVTEKYRNFRKNSYMSSLIDFENDVNYNNIVKRDLELIKKPKIPLIRVTLLLKFDKYDQKKWFCLYDGKYIKQYSGETVKRNLMFSMKRHLDESYDADLILKIFELYDSRDLMYANIMSQALFSVQMKLLKAT